MGERLRTEIEQELNHGQIKQGHKLNVQEQLQLCSLLAVGYNPERCQDIFKKEYGITLTSQNIRCNYLNSKKWRKVIARFIRESDRQVLKHPLAKKINRLKILLVAINEALAKGLGAGAIASLVREARAEVEGDKPLVDLSVHHHKTFYQNIIKKAGIDELPESVASRIKGEAKLN